MNVLMNNEYLKGLEALEEYIKSLTDLNIVMGEKILILQENVTKVAEQVNQLAEIVKNNSKI